MKGQSGIGGTKTEECDSSPSFDMSIRLKKKHINELISRILSRQEHINMMIKRFEIMSNTFTHNRVKHPTCLRAVANIVQLKLRVGNETLPEVQWL